MSNFLGKLNIKFDRIYSRVDINFSLYVTGTSNLAKYVETKRIFDNNSILRIKMYVNNIGLHLAGFYSIIPEIKKDVKNIYDIFTEEEYTKIKGLAYKYLCFILNYIKDNYDILLKGEYVSLEADGNINLVNYYRSMGFELKKDYVYNDKKTLHPMIGNLYDIIYKCSSTKPIQDKIKIKIDLGQKRNSNDKIPFKNGIIHGTIYTYDDKDNVSSITEYKDDKKNGIETLYEDGKVKQITTYDNNRKNGIEKIFDDTGNIEYINEYTYNKIISSKNYEEGNLILEREYIDGKILTKIYDKKGNLIEEKTHQPRSKQRLKRR